MMVPLCLIVGKQCVGGWDGRKELRRSVIYLNRMWLVGRFNTVRAGSYPV